MACQIVAELSANHLGSIDRALALVDVAAEAGADAIKLQTFTPEQMTDVWTVITTGPWAGRHLIDLYHEALTPRHWHRTLFDYARTKGLTAFSSVFHPDDVDFLEAIDCPIYKIASFELTDSRLIRYAARTGKPIVISTGMAMIDEIDLAVRNARFGGAKDITLLKCTSAYPAGAADAHLATMAHMRETFHCKVGLSDHTIGIGLAVAAVALGATMIEKHITLSRDDGGLDAGFSMEPMEFTQLVFECRNAEAALGAVTYGPRRAERSSLSLRRASGGKRGAPLPAVRGA